MASILVAYGTREGQTEKIAERIAAELESRGHEATTHSVKDRTADVSVAAFDGVLVGSSIHMGKHSDDVYRWVRENRVDIVSLPNGFFQVSLSSAVDDEERQAEVASYLAAFVEESDWHPDRVAAFGGALRYSEYGFLTRMIMKRIAKDATGDTDASRDYEYTDWDEVEAFADEFAALVDGDEATPAGGHSPDAR